MSIIDELNELLESASGKKARKLAAKQDAKLKGKDKIAKDLGFDFDEDKSWEDYLTNLAHWKALIKSKDKLTNGGGYKSVMSGLTTAANAYADTDVKNTNFNKPLANKIKTLQAKLRKYYRKED